MDSSRSKDGGGAVGPSRQGRLGEPRAAETACKTRVLGGKWTAENLHVAADAIGGFAATHDAKDFCRLYGLQNAMRFNIAKFSEPIAAALALHWTRVMDYYYELWYEQPDAAYIFKDEDHEQRPYTEQLGDVADGLPSGHPVWEAVLKIDQVRPSRPVAGVAPAGASSSTAG